jgi:peptidase E
MALDEFVLSLTGKARPRVCYIPTAAGDSEAYIKAFYDCLGPKCEPSHLSLFLPPFRRPQEVLADQDIMYVSGGSTPNLLAVWRTHGIERLLSRAHQTGTILYGSSAGGLCWFHSGLTDSLGFDGRLRAFTDGLGLLPGSHCPHFDTEPDRRPTYLRLVQEGGLDGGHAIDEFAAVHFVDTRVVQTVASRRDAGAYWIERGQHDHPRLDALAVDLL